MMIIDHAVYESFRAECRIAGMERVLEDCGGATQARVAVKMARGHGARRAIEARDAGEPAHAARYRAISEDLHRTVDSVLEMYADL